MPTLNTNNYGATLAEAERHLANREPFHTGTLSASWEKLEGIDDPRYIVRSYGVEIADSEEGAIHPEAYTHSVTTSKHANIVARAWGIA